MPDDIIIFNDLPPQFLALKQETLDAAMLLCERAHEFVIPNPAIDEYASRSAHAEASRLYTLIDSMSKELDSRRLEAGRPITALKSRLDATVAAAVKPLEDQRAKLGAKIRTADKAFDQVDAEKKRAAEAEQRRRDEERRQAEEQARREEAKRRADEAKRAADAADAKAKGVDLPPDEIAPAPVKAAAPATRIVDAEPAPYIAPPPKSPIKGRTDYDVEVENLAIVPDDIAGAPLWQLDKPAALKLMKAGIKIPGLRLVEIEATSSKGRSSAFAV